MGIKATETLVSGTMKVYGLPEGQGLVRQNDIARAAFSGFLTQNAFQSYFNEILQPKKSVASVFVALTELRCLMFNKTAP